MKYSTLFIGLTIFLSKATLGFPVDTETHDPAERDSFNISATAQGYPDNTNEDRSLHQFIERAVTRKKKPAPSKPSTTKGPLRKILPKPGPGRVTKQPSKAPTRPKSPPTQTSAAPMATYTIPCRDEKYPNVCQNWCYYVNYWDCDEQPKNTNREGGSNAATRCMPRSENRSEGSTWGNWINNPGNGTAGIANGQQVRVHLDFTEANASAGYCAGAQACGVRMRGDSAAAVNDGPRQL
ncbi:hypothetical protein P691DRAFT_791204 [Macrolepiota fuliginosa MF-IS2]|uniref:Deoxyribonuclease NucA/NucB domain-containing protein n=1 Tax=Macrolepiota fuliginosa MF-IS2 TaxID=1400762 RepID=A0A9P6BVA2_9AGAR|nr:hypothetical protein P691DRAFT_791204 [Macrolepiota fuliginosa MF-IS2]